MGKRLGVTDDCRDIKCHAFFASIDWVALDRKEIAPPYNPNTVSNHQAMLLPTVKIVVLSAWILSNTMVSVDNILVHVDSSY